MNWVKFLLIYRRMNFSPHFSLSVIYHICISPFDYMHTFPLVSSTPSSWLLSTFSSVTVTSLTGSLGVSSTVLFGYTVVFSSTVVCSTTVFFSSTVVLAHSGATAFSLFPAHSRSLQQPAILCRYYRNRPSYSRIEVVAGVRREGTVQLSLSAIALKILRSIRSIDCSIKGRMRRMKWKMMRKTSIHFMQIDSLLLMIIPLNI